jgi:hypothetical protein
LLYLTDDHQYRDAKHQRCQAESIGSQPANAIGEQPDENHHGHSEQAEKALRAPNAMATVRNATPMITQ